MDKRVTSIILITFLVSLSEVGWGRGSSGSPRMKLGSLGSILGSEGPGMDVTISLSHITLSSQRLYTNS